MSKIAVVISLDEERFQRTKKELSPYFDEVGRWIGCDTRNGGYPLRAKMQQPGALGCLMSHLEVLELAILKDWDYLYVFEDDVKVIRWPSEEPECDLLYYGATQLYWTPEMEGSCYKANKTLGTFAMRISKKLYQPLLELLSRTEHTIDNAIAEEIQPKYDCRVLRGCVISDVTNSSIRRRVNPVEWHRKVRWPLPKKRVFEECVTFGITSFERPEHLKRCVESVKKWHPNAKIMVADNSSVHPPETTLFLPYDAGASACRNALMNACETDYLMLLEEDFILTEPVNDFFDFLEWEVGYSCIGGSLQIGDRTMHSGVRLKDNEFSGAGWQATGSLVWRPCDMTFDFCMLRKGCGLWDERLKIGGEHRDFFERIRGKVAYTPMVSCIHDISGRSVLYRELRGRHFGKKVEWDKDVYRHFTEKPNILVFGVGHSGTTILTKMLMALGWKSPRADDEFAEDVVIRCWNQSYLRGTDPGAALVALPNPWVIKDPRFVVTLDAWYDVFCQYQIMMVAVERDRNDVRESYKRRGESIEKSHGGHSVDELHEMFERQFKRWPWAKVRVRYEDLGQAMKLWRPS